MSSSLQVWIQAQKIWSNRKYLGHLYQLRRNVNIFYEWYVELNVANVKIGHDLYFF